MCPGHRTDAAAGSGGSADAEADAKATQVLTLPGITINQSPAGIATVIAVPAFARRSAILAARIITRLSAFRVNEQANAQRNVQVHR